MTDLNEKALEAAADALYGTAGFSGRVASLDKQQAHFTAMLAIRAYLATAGGGVEAVRMKPLEWVKHPSADLWRADSILGRHQAYAVISQISWAFDAFDGITRTSGDASSLSEAKAAAQADYERRIRSALFNPVVPEGWRPVPEEPSAEMLRAGMDDLGWWVEPYTAPRESGVPTDNDRAGGQSLVTRVRVVTAQVERLSEALRKIVSTYDRNWDRQREKLDACIPLARAALSAGRGE